MKKDIYEILNDSNIGIDNYIKYELNDIEKKKMKNNFRKSIKNKKSIKKLPIAIAISLLLTTALVTTNLGSEILVSATIATSNISSYLGLNKNLDKYSTIINKYISKNGVTISLNDVILNNNELIVSSTIQSSKGDATNEGFHEYSKIFINGKRIKSGSTGSSKAIDTSTMASITNYILPDIDLSKEIDIKIIYSDVLVGNKPIYGPWIFEFKANGSDLSKDTKRIALNNSFSLDNGNEVTLNEFTSNSMGQEIFYTIKNNNSTDKNVYDIKLVGTDNLNNPIEFDLSSGNYTGGILKLEPVLGKLSDKATSISLTPYAVKFPEKSGKLSDDFKKIGDKFTINFDN
ncbi:DUF4179 domain-containing protein [Clostridium sardiniense]|uniref:DUF4179 domain-containing protein n=1 Tax=Clostridium sardiniense TaxID=29369 RepID=UPI003D332A2E